MTSPAASLPTTRRTPSRFTSSLPNPEFLDRLTLTDAVAVPAGTPLHDVGLHPLPATGPYEWTSLTQKEVTLVRNPYFHEWSHAAQPDGYPDRIVYRLAANPAGRDHGDRARQRRLHLRPAPLRPHRRAANTVRQPAAHQPLTVYRRTGPQHPSSAVQRRPRPPGDQLRDRPRQDRTAARPSHPAHAARHSRPTSPAIDPTAPTRWTPTQPASGTHPTSPRASG